MNNKQKVKYWKNKAFEYKKMYQQINKYNVVLDDFLDVSKEELEKEVNTTSMKLKKMMSIDNGIKAKSKSLFKKLYLVLKRWILQPKTKKGKMFRFSLIVGLKMLLVFEVVKVSPEVFKFLEFLLAFI